MLIPSKHEKLERNTLVIGADILTLLKKSNLSVESLFDSLKIRKSLSLDDLYHSLLFLWLSDVIILEQNLVKLKDKKIQ